MARIRSNDKTRQLIYVFNNVIGGCISIEITHPDKENEYNHCNLSQEEFESFIDDCQLILARSKGF